MREKIHYVYKTINLKNNKEYIGVRSHPNPDEDNYLGSGTCILNVIKKEGIENFKKIILKKFDTREKAVEYESFLLTEEYCNNPNTYNIINTGSDGFNKHCFRKDLWYDYFDEIRKKYIQGKTLKELGKIYNCDRGTIKNICNDLLRSISESQQLRFKKYPGHTRNKKVDSDVRKIIKLYKSGKSISKIAEIYNVSTPVIRKRLVENDIKRRNKGRKPQK